MLLLFDFVVSLGRAHFQPMVSDMYSSVVNEYRWLLAKNDSP